MNLKEFFLDTLFPPYCLICKISHLATMKNKAICEACEQNIKVHETLFCIACRARLANDTRICHANTPLRLAAVGRYDNPGLQSLISQLKYKRHTLASKALGALMDRYLRKLQFEFTDYHIIPIPLHPKRERERGFNQSLILAEHLAKSLQIPLLKTAFTKIKPTIAQAKTQNLHERKNNLLGCFAVSDVQAIQNKKILLVDDVCTSGATLIEAAHTLKRAGAKNIIGFVMART